MKLIFFGTSSFAIPALEKLTEAGYEIAAVVTQPDKPAGRHLAPLPSPVKLWAQKHKLRVLQPTSLQLSPSPGERVPPSLSLPKRWGGNKGEVELKDIDIVIIASYGKIIPKEIIDAPKHGSINIHPSLLPKYRGPSPIQAAILNGDAETGVTIIQLDEKMDHGPVVAQQKLTTYNLQLYYMELHDKLAKLGAELLIKILPDYLAGKIKPVAQDDSLATFTKIINKTDAKIDWHSSAQEIERQVRAYHVWPVAWSRLDGKRLKIFKAQAKELPSASPLLKRGEGGVGEKSPGLAVIETNQILVQCQNSLLEIQQLQLEGGKILDSQSFANGYRDLDGQILG